MQRINSMHELGRIAGAYGPLESIPNLGDLMGHSLLDMVVIAYSKLGSPSGVFQNDGTVFPTHRRISLFKKFCQAIRSTEKGKMRCIACDCQAVIKLTGGFRVNPDSFLEKAMRKFPIEQIDEFGLPNENVHCYKCHTGLLEFVRPISLDLEEKSPVPVGAIWAGQNKVDVYSLSQNDVYKLAQEIGYMNPKLLFRHYKKIRPISKKELSEIAKSLAKTACPIEDSASVSLHVKKQAQFDRLSNQVLNSLRTSLIQIKGASESTIQKKVYASSMPLLQGITSTIENCFSAICEIPEDSGESKDSKIEIQVRAYAGPTRRKLEKINIKRSEVDKIFSGIEGPDDFKLFSFYNNVDWEFFTKIKNAIQIDNISHAIISCIPAVQNKILWVTLLFENCDVLTPSGNVLPDFVRMMDNILKGITQIINTAYLVAERQDTVKILVKQKKQLEKKDYESKLLLRNIAHQVSRPIMELKQSAYILSQGFSNLAYDGFRACMTELERGVRNFDIYEKLTTDFDKRRFDLQTHSSFNIRDIVNKSHERVKPFLRADRNRELLIRECVPMGHAIPHVIGNAEATLECLVNVFHNAIKYSIGSRPIEVEISYRPGYFVHIRTTNYGIELSKDEWERVFEDTVRAETAKTIAVEGSGMGLYISRKLIEIHGGQVKVESSEEAPPTKYGVARWRTTFLISLKC